MRVIHGLDDPALPLQDCAVAIGVFDGVHRGHQEVLNLTAAEADRSGLTPIALTFDVHPMELFAPLLAPRYIASLSQRCSLIGEFGGGTRTVLVVRFDTTFALLEPEQFVSQILCGRVGARHVVIGEDFRYGRGRAGTVATMRDASAAAGFRVTVAPPVHVDGERISSTRIRALIISGQIEPARQLLGHPFVLRGKVVHGKKLGRSIGFPTANVVPEQAGQLVPGNGVYGALASVEGGRRVYRAAVSVGTNPTTDMDGSVKIEANLLDAFDEDIYDRTLSLDFRLRVRSEQKFRAISDLVGQMEADVHYIKQNLPPPTPA